MTPEVQAQKKKNRWIGLYKKVYLSVCLQCRKPRFDSWVGKIPWRRKWQPTPVFLPGESHGRRSLVGYSPRGHKELDTTERLHFHIYIYRSNIQITLTTQQHKYNPFFKWKSNWIDILSKKIYKWPRSTWNVVAQCH